MEIDTLIANVLVCFVSYEERALYKSSLLVCFIYVGSCISCERKIGYCGSVADYSMASLLSVTAKARSHRHSADL